MGALIELAEALAERRTREQVGRIAAQWRDAAPDARVSEDGKSVIVEARGLGRRWLSDPLLRFAGSLTR